MEDDQLSDSDSSIAAASNHAAGDEIEDVLA
jgi:hypothetical protein